MTLIIFEGLKLTGKHKIKLEPGLFEWMAWYPDGVPDWLHKEELEEAKYNIDNDYQPFVTVNNLNETVKETTEEFYTRNYDVLRKIIDSTGKYESEKEKEFNNFKFPYNFV